jgi:hypothetical protein
MLDRWFLGPACNDAGPYHLDQLQRMIDAGDLKLTDLVWQEGAQKPIPVREVPGLRTTKWLRPRLIVGTCAGIAVLVALWLFFPSGTPPQNPDLPEWFSPAYRIKTNRAIIFPLTWPKQGSKPNPGKANTSPGGKYTEEWLDEHFTHYIGKDNAFVWTSPPVRYPSHGKILAGIKVIMGEEVDDMSLVCTITADGKPENMYLETARLRRRSQGPPPAPKDD